MTSAAPTTLTVSGAASTLLSDLLDASCPLVEVARTRTAVHYDTGRDDVPVLCLAGPDAVRLPNALVTRSLPQQRVLTDVTWQVTRWWPPSRPTGLLPPRRERLAGLASRRYDELDPHALVGRGAGLTPEGDDVLAGALVAAAATADPRRDGWRAVTREALAVRRTTAVSRGLLHHALDGYAVPQLAALLTALCTGGDLAMPLARLLAVGHSSGAALLDGVVHALSTHPLRERNDLDLDLDLSEGAA